MTQPTTKLDKNGKRYLTTMTLWPFFQLALFLAFANRGDLPLGLWLFFGTNLLAVPTGAFVAARYNPAIINYRGIRRKPGIKTWDKILVHLFGIFGFHVPIIVAALDLAKYHWMTLPLAVSIAGVILFIAGRGIFVWGMCVNNFFDTMVHIQDDRSHKVITTGPYQYVRHPGYTGAILWLLSVPFILGSVMALVPALIGAALLIVRTYLEDTMLKKELEGYTDYAARVKYRIFPGIW